jgi:hypothetical protein
MDSREMRKEEETVLREFLICSTQGAHVEGRSGEHSPRASANTDALLGKQRPQCEGVDFGQIDHILNCE